MKLNRIVCLPVVLLVLAQSPASAQPPTPRMPTPEEMLQEWESAQVWPLDVASAPVLGPADAPIRVVEFADYLCPACGRLAKAWDSYVPAAGGRFTVHFKNYPLDSTCNENINRPIHPGACWLALGSICAAEQQKFKPYNELAFTSPPANPNAQDVAELAAKAGLDRAAMEGCLQSPETMRKLKSEIAELAATGSKSTPTLFMNGKRLPQVYFFNVWLEAESRRLGLSTAGAR
jgi:protein-disulfide isomerase